MTGPDALDRRFCVAPMMDWTDAYCRAFHRVLSRRAVLYSEMVTSAAILHGDRDRLLGFDPQAEGPVALQLGGSDPAELARAARAGADYGYPEINLNCGCPSDRVQNGSFGACLMGEPERVADCVAAMRAAVALPVTVKCRIGIDDQSEEEPLSRFVGLIRDAGCRTVIVHARKAWLEGLSPKENREIPPLNYDRVHRLKAEFPDLEVILNGGLATLDAALPHIAPGGLDGVMLGRAAYHEPWCLAAVDQRVYAAADACVASRAEAVERFRPFIAAALARGVPLARITRHMLGLWHGQYGGRAFRRILSTEAHQTGAGLEVLDRAVAATRRPEDLAAAE